MPIDRKHIGVASEPREVEVEVGQLRFFAKATGETNPIYFDEQAARSAGHRTLPAPPTFLFCLQRGAPARKGDLYDSKNGIGVDPKRILHGEQSFTHRETIYAGDTLTLVTTTRDIYEKKSGSLEFIVQETIARNSSGEVCCEMRNVTVVRDDR